MVKVEMTVANMDMPTCCGDCDFECTCQYVDGNFAGKECMFTGEDIEANRDYARGTMCPLKED